MGRGSLVVGLSILATAVPGGASAQVVGPQLPTNDLSSVLALTGGQVFLTYGKTIPGPPLKPVPRAECGPGSQPLEGGVQGRVTAADMASPQAERGWTCNTRRVARLPTPGGFRTWRYEDRNGHVCAFYDTSLPQPLAAVSLLAGPTAGTAVVDMTDPTKPVQTTLLTSLAMLAPHESLNLNAKRGLLAANTGNGGTLPGEIAIYDVSQDCRRPVLQGQMPILFGHESGFSPDGNTYWVGGGAGKVLAVDVRNPKAPYTVWEGNMYSHGLGVSADGRTLYQTDPINGNLGIHDVSEVQDRKPDPQVRELSRSTWDTVSIPQNALPITLGGTPYLLEFDEFAFRFNPATVDDRVGAARLIDITDPAKPVITSDLRLEVNMRDEHRRALSDPYALVVGAATGYAAHYCGVPREVDPTIVACSFLNSGLRIFDIRQPKAPKEVGYHLPPAREGTNPVQQGAFAFSQPAFDEARKQLWYTDASSGFHVLQLDERSWPDRVPRRCTSARVVTITLPRGTRSATVTYGSRRARVTRSRGRLKARVDLRGRPAQTVTVRVRGRSAGGKRVTQTRRFKTCRGRPA